MPAKKGIEQVEGWPVIDLQAARFEGVALAKA